MKKIGIDIRMISYSGIGRYLNGIISHFSNFRDHDYFLIGESSKPQFKNIRLRAPVYSLQEQWFLSRLSSQIDCLHSPHYNAPLIWKGKLIVTIHDLIHIHFPEFSPSFAARIYAKTIIPRVVQRADRIIAVSEFTKSDLIKTFHVKPEKITVIYHGVDKTLTKSGMKNNPSQEPPYFLYVGLIKAHKNLGILIEAFKRWKKNKKTEARLKIIGRADTKQKIVQKWLHDIEAEPDISWTGEVSDEALKAAYLDARALILPSLYEGFGFPLIEAMASGIPLLASRAASIPEITGPKAALYFDPYSITELEQGLDQIYGDESLRQTLIAEGQKRLALFDWNQAARKTQEVYDSVF